MERLTHTRLLEKLADALDESGSVYFADSVMADALNAAYLDWLAGAAMAPERDAKTAQRLLPLLRQQVLTLAAGRANLSDLDALPYSLRAVEVRRPGSAEWVPAAPLSHDSRALALADPWRRPTPQSARYSTVGEESEGAPPLWLAVHTDGPAEAVRVTYLKLPRPIEPGGEGVTEVDRPVQEELIARAAVKLAIPSGNAGVWQGQSAEYPKSN